MANLPPLPGRAHYPGSGNPPGHAQHINPNPAPHVVLGTSVLADPAPGEELIYLAMGCFWGAEKLMWELRARFPNAVIENPLSNRREKYFGCHLACTIL
ncbi:hypothetical protein [Actinotignum urinale]|uniref:hypothetical protein n=1 Tax=Actinotignum urinale TaxID=190146 RepID=UPI0003B75161|nr:hypothetical protein [Actinotignum urinale]MDY5159725.1 hypothetical protein [Actinotignum urinale]